MTQFTAFGKEIKKHLVDIDQTQDWLIGQVREETGLYFDSSYLYKIMIGRLSTPGIIAAIRKNLELPESESNARGAT